MIYISLALSKADHSVCKGIYVVIVALFIDSYRTFRGIISVCSVRHIVGQLYGNSLHRFRAHSFDFVYSLQLLQKTCRLGPGHVFRHSILERLIRERIPVGYIKLLAQCRLLLRCCFFHKLMKVRFRYKLAPRHGCLHEHIRIHHKLSRSIHYSERSEDGIARQCLGDLLLERLGLFLCECQINSFCQGFSRNSNVVSRLIFKAERVKSLGLCLGIQHYSLGIVDNERRHGRDSIHAVKLTQGKLLLHAHVLAVCLGKALLQSIIFAFDVFEHFKSRLVCRLGLREISGFFKYGIRSAFIYGSIGEGIISRSAYA